MSRTKKPSTATPQLARKAVADLLLDNARRRHLHEVFSDFVEMAACAISNRFDQVNFAAREARYDAISKRYEPDEKKRFGEALGALTMAIEAVRFDDVLGKIFMECDLGSKFGGQFFTPFELSLLMARMTFDKDTLLRQVEEQGFITIHDPCVGGGSNVIAAAQVLEEFGIGTRQAHFSVIDVDARCVAMAYIQLSLMGVPAVVLHANTLTMEERGPAWYTPAHYLGNWSYRLRARAEARELARQVEEASSDAPVAAAAAAGQSAQFVVPDIAANDDRPAFELTG